MADVDVVTGAFGYTGRYITGRLLESGRSVKTLTGHPNRPSPFGDRVGVAAFDFDDRRRLAEHLRGATTLYNTYWVRFPHGDVTFERAFANSETIIGAARDAGMNRIVHVSITNPSEDSPFGVFPGQGHPPEWKRRASAPRTPSSSARVAASRALSSPRPGTSHPSKEWLSQADSFRRYARWLT
jgi:nucleoside-diphosphate-sugar epimerase